MQKPVWYRVGAVVCGLASALAHAQTRDFPTRPIRVVVPTSPGGILDVVMRVVGPRMTEQMGQTIVIDNRSGASTNIGSELVARAQGDGYTLLCNSLPVVVNASLFPKMPFDVEKDFATVSLLTTSPYVVVAHPSLPAKSLKELIALAKARPGVINYATGGNGTNLHIATELFKNLSGASFTHVPYKGAGLGLASVVAGQTELSFPALAAALPQINAGRLRALAVTSKRRSQALPGIPTVGEAGVPGYEFASWVGIFAPASTPAGIVTPLNGHFVKAIRSPDLVSRFAAEGTEVVASSPAEFAAFIKAEATRWPKVIKEANIKAE